jgi:hypothetical protein
MRWCVSPKAQRILYVLTNPDISYYNGLKQDMYNLAKNSNWVWIFLKKSAPKIDFYKHTHIKEFRLSNFFFHLETTGRILFKKKKFLKVLVDDENLDAILRILKRYHNAEVQLVHCVINS